MDKELQEAAEDLGEALDYCADLTELIYPVWKDDEVALLLLQSPNPVD